MHVRECSVVVGGHRKLAHVHVQLRPLASEGLHLRGCELVDARGAHPPELGGVRERGLGLGIGGMRLAVLVARLVQQREVDVVGSPLCAGHVQHR